LPLHALRQSGKTTFLNATIDKINEEGQNYALYYSLNSLKDVKDKEFMAEGVVELLKSAPEREKKFAAAWPSTKKWLPNIYVRKVLSDLCSTLDKPLVVFFDEADSLSGDPLITFFTQLRDRFNIRTKTPFPISIALIGMRQI
jgi:Cdc6-like AAA superfamily ATPase